MKLRLLAALALGTTFGVLACSGDDGVAGEAGKKGDKGDPASASFDLVLPSKGVAGREVDVTITAPSLTGEALSVDFGDPSITVTDVKRAGDGTITAHVAIDAKATLGARDVKVTSGEVSVTGKAAFRVASGMDVSVVGGAAEQGGIFRARFVNNDEANAFDTGSTGDGFFTPIEPNFLVQGVGVASLSTDFVSVSEVQATFLADPTGSGNVAFVGANAPGGAKPTLTFLAPPDAVKIAPRAPVTLVGGAATSAVLAKPYETKLFKIAVPPATSIFSFDVVGTGAAVVPTAYILGSKGKLSDLFTGGQGDAPKTTKTFSFPVTATANAGDFWFIVFDGKLKGGAATDYGFEVKAAVTGAGSVDEQGAAHGTTGAAQTIATLPAVVKGKVTTDTEEDIYKISVPANATVELSFAPGFDGTAEIVAGTNFDASVYADVTGKAGRVTIKNGAAATDHYVRVMGDSFGATPTGDYLFSLRVLP